MSEMTPTNKWDIVCKVVEMLTENNRLQTPREPPVVQFHHPEVLGRELAMGLEDEPTDDDALLERCLMVLKNSVQMGHPQFFDKLFAGVDPYGLAGAWLTSAANTSACSYEVAPAFTMLEREVIKNVATKMFEFPDDAEGIFVPGSCIGNMYAMALARLKTCPDVKTKGASETDPLALFVSEDSQFTVMKGAAWLGLGFEAVVKVPSDDLGRMIPAELEKCIKNAKSSGRTPFLVVAIAGSNVLGGIDPISAVADICAKNKLWLHVDGSWGGALLLSEKLKTKLKGVNQADSVGWDAHKMLGAPLQCSVLVVKEKGALRNLSSVVVPDGHPPRTRFYDSSFDTCDMTMQCSRQVDAFKLWMMWKARGDSGLGLLVDNAQECALHFLSLIRDRPGFYLVSCEIECPNVCFWFVPARLRDQEETCEWWTEINQLSPKLKEKLILSGNMMISCMSLPHKQLKHFFRLAVTCQPPRTKADMEQAVKTIEEEGDKC